jgi:hypothetical protein
LLSSLGGKIRESAVSVIPIMAIVALLHLTLARLPEGQLARFMFGGVLIILGLSIFLLGAELGMVNFGERIGGALTRRRNIALILAASFIIGFAITIAEPDVQVLATQVAGIDPEINRGLLLTLIAFGVGFFLLLAMLRVFLRLSLRLLLVGFYLLLFIACAFIDPGFVGVAFDSGGATTGPITVPFIMAMGIGVASSMARRGGDDNSFGFVGLASIGPVMAVALMGLLSKVKLGGGEVGAGEDAHPGLFDSFLYEIPRVGGEIAVALAPIFVLFLIFQFFLLRLPRELVRRMLIGFLYSFIGLVMFMVGVAGGFTPIGRSLGMGLGDLVGGWLLLPVGLILGAVVVCAEPAVWVLTEQVEAVSGGYIKRKYLLAALSFSIAVAVALGIGIQNFPEGAAVSIPLRKEGLSRAKCFFYGQASGLVEPVGAVLGAFLVTIIEALLPYALTFAAGAMIYVVVEELIPAAQEGDHHSTDLSAIGAIIGFTVMMALDVALG